MRGIDTNVLLRYIAADDPEQTRIAAGLIVAAEQAGDEFVLFEDSPAAFLNVHRVPRG